MKKNTIKIKQKYIPSFTLIEMMVSIILFSIIIVFLYQVLDMTQKSNRFYTKKLEEQKAKTKLSSIFFLDIMHAQPIKIGKGGQLYDIGIDNELNSNLWLKTTHTYHNPFYNHVFYFVSKKQNLIRLESLNKFDKSKSGDTFFATAYSDVIVSGVTKFKVAKHKNSNKLAIYLQLNNKEDYIFSYGAIKTVTTKSSEQSSPPPVADELQAEEY